MYIKPRNHINWRRPKAEVTFSLNPQYIYLVVPNTADSSTPQSELIFLSCNAHCSQFIYSSDFRKMLKENLLFFCDKDDNKI